VWILPSLAVAMVEEDPGAAPFSGPLLLKERVIERGRLFDRGQLSPPLFFFLR